MNPLKPILVSLLTIAVALAGCAGGDEATGPDPGEFVDPGADLGTKGAIAGLLVDDRFRPLQLTDDPETEFQTTGFVLLQETGEQAQTTENGEFQFVDLEPGAYTIRVTAGGHEATPLRVNVVEGEFTEQTIIARRTLSSGGAIITEEYTAFVPCMLNAPAVTAQCVAVPPDFSGETNREGFWTDFQKFPDATEVIIELLTNKEASIDGAIKVVVRNETDDCYLVNDFITSGNYLRMKMTNGGISEHDVEARNCMWTNADRQLVQLWAQGQFKEESQVIFDTTCAGGQGVFCTADSRGVGAQLGVVGRFVISVFLGPPELDIDAYCALCGG